MSIFDKVVLDKSAQDSNDNLIVLCKQLESFLNQMKSSSQQLSALAMLGDVYRQASSAIECDCKMRAEDAIAAVAEQAVVAEVKE